MSRQKLILILSGVSLAIVVLIAGLGVNYYRTQTIAGPVDRFVEGLTAKSPDESLFTDAYLANLQQTKNEAVVDTQGFDEAYGSFSSTLRYTGVTDVNISGDSATCVASAIETTTNSLTGDKNISSQTYKLGLVKVNGEWKIDSAELIESKTR